MMSRLWLNSLLIVTMVMFAQTYMVSSSDSGQNDSSTCGCNDDKPWKPDCHPVNNIQIGGSYYDSSLGDLSSATDDLLNMTRQILDSLQNSRVPEPITESDHSSATDDLLNMTRQILDSLQNSRVPEAITESDLSSATDDLFNMTRQILDSLQNSRVPEPITESDHSSATDDLLHMTGQILDSLQNSRVPEPITERSGQPYITTTSRGFTSTETGNPFFTCLKSSPGLEATVLTGRYVYTYNDINDPANGDPPPSFSVGNPRVSQGCRTDLNTSLHWSYGVFYCEASLDGERSVVPTIFLRSDAKFVPTNGRFSKTVNKGDVDVTVDFTELNPTEMNINWRLNGTTNPSVTISAGTDLVQMTVYTIPEVDTSHAGVYEIHLAAERGMARAGLLRLIVRACPAGRYNVSSECTSICPSCYNGGICHDEKGICICPPGFQGDSCEIACGGNRYGRNCEYRCDYELADDKTACSGLQVCVPDPYGCSCTPGYKGLDCTTACDEGEFGASCTETCHCVSGECDRFTGVCTGSSTACQPGWTGNNCQDDSNPHTFPRDCSEVQAYGLNTSGVYAIYPDGPGDPFLVSCDMDTDGGGWTVFQRRQDGSVDFYLYWSDYKYGFGSVPGEHWLGNDRIHRLTAQKTYQLRVDLEDFEGQTRYAQYSSFIIGDEAGNYVMTVGDYSGDAGDSLSVQSSGHPFSTRDRDNDATANENCAASYTGAWWYKACHASNLNGRYLNGTTTVYAAGVTWSSWRDQYYSLKKTEMKIRPV